MKELVLAVILGLTFSKVLAQETNAQPMQFPLAATCDKTETIHDFLSGYNEEQFAHSDVIVSAMNGEDYRGKMVIWVSPKSRSSTVTVEFEQDGMTCIMAMGENFGPAVDEKPI